MADEKKNHSGLTPPETAKKSDEQVKAAADKNAAAASTPSKPEAEKKPSNPSKSAANTKTDADNPTKPEGEKKPMAPVKSDTDSKVASSPPAKPEAEKKPAQDAKEAAAPDKKDDSNIKANTEKIPIGLGETDSVTMMDISQIHRFEGHPFKVSDNKDMWDLVESIKQFGVLEPAVVIPRKEGGYEMVSGHRRQRACQLAGLTSMPVIVRQLDRDEATISMVDANLKRENISPMEKARAYEMKLEAMKRKAGRRSKMDILTGSVPKRADQELAEQVGESRATIQRMTRLTKLEPELQVLVDEKKLPVNTGADISYLKPEEQKKVVDVIQREDKVPTGAQAAELKQASQKGQLTPDKIEKTIMPKPAKDPELKVTFTNDELRPYFPDKGATVADVKRGVFDALNLRKKAIERQAAKTAQEKSSKSTPVR